MKGKEINLSLGTITREDIAEELAYRRVNWQDMYTEEQEKKVLGLDDFAFQHVVEFALENLCDDLPQSVMTYLIEALPKDES